MTTLRQQMVRHMEMKGYSSRTIKHYVKCIEALALRYNTPPDLLTGEQIKQYLHEPHSS